MSTKIYDGLKSNFSDPFVIGEKIREVLELVFFEKFHKIYNEYRVLVDSGVSHQWDYHSRFFHGDKFSVDLPSSHFLVKHLYDNISYLHNSSTWTLSDADIMYDVVLVPNGVSEENPLVMVFGENSGEYINALIESGIVVDYGYWDNSEHPEDVTDEEWEKRKMEWSSLDYASPNRVGLTLSSPSSLDTAINVSETYNRKRKEELNNS